DVLAEELCKEPFDHFMLRRTAAPVRRLAVLPTAGFPQDPLVVPFTDNRLHSRVLPHERLDGPRRRSVLPTGRWSPDERLGSRKRSIVLPVVLIRLDARGRPPFQVRDPLVGDRPAAGPHDACRSGRHWVLLDRRLGLSVD